jgi:Cu2+-exporting ATPase
MGLPSPTPVTSVAPAPFSAACFHCALPIPAHTNLTIVWDGALRAFCCRGCEAVAQAIIAGGLDDYYRLRTSVSTTGRELVPDELREFAAYDHPSVQQQLVHRAGDNCDVSLILEGITCTACLWLNEAHLKRLSGVRAVQMNYATRRARVFWDRTHLSLSEILRSVRAIGYDAYPYDPARHQQLQVRERRGLLLRLGVAGILGAQVMTLSVALYVGDWSGTDPALRTFFYYVSFLLTLPVLLYSGWAFFRGAWNDLRRARAGMDVPIALGLSGAFAASVWTTVTGVGTVYYDSVSMFIFLLLAGRYVEYAARVRAIESAESLVQARPAVAMRLDAQGTVTQVSVAELVPGDVVRVRPGDTVPADGCVMAGTSSVNESLLTGESRPLTKEPGDAVIAGSINVESPLTVRIDNTGADTVLSAILRLLDRAQTEKPELAKLADRIAGGFVVGVLVLAALCGLYWWQVDPARAWMIVVVVLVVTCPCALGLATPTALAAATGTLARAGLLTTRGHALETLARATHFIFDKTGTLTRGELTVVRVDAHATTSASECAALAAALERHSEHPLARALISASPHDERDANEVANYPGEGLRGVVADVPLYIGTVSFVHRMTGLQIDVGRLMSSCRHGETAVVLATPRTHLATFILRDTLRSGAVESLTELKNLGKHLVLLTGDHAPAAEHVARELDIDTIQVRLKPHEKLAYVQRLQESGAVVAMIGDGINDAPVLAAAHVSIAMGGAAHVSAASADMILLASDLRRLVTGLRVARRSLAIIRQNLVWASAYNIIAVPAAALGWVTPWMAALGMSLSSLFVVLNAARLSSDGIADPKRA